jgi:hypothetical protein
VGYVPKWSSRRPRAAKQLERSLTAKRSTALLAFEHMSGRVEVLFERPLVIKRLIVVVVVVVVVH